MSDVKEKDVEEKSTRAWGLKRALVWPLAAAYAVLWVGGVASHAVLGGVSRGQEWLAPVFLSLAGALALAGAHSARERARLAAVALFGFAVEVLGVHSGFPFGAYRYTGALAPLAFGVPLVMACAWVTLVAYAREVTARLRLPFPLACAVAAAWMTSIDLVIDPLAANRLGYWRWLGAGAYYGVPATNFAGWLASGFVALAIYGRPTGRNPLARRVGLSVVLFFSLVAAAHALVVPSLVGFALCTLDLVLARRR